MYFFVVDNIVIKSIWLLFYRFKLQMRFLTMAWSMKSVDYSISNSASSSCNFKIVTPSGGNVNDIE